MLWFIISLIVTIAIIVYMFREESWCWSFWEILGWGFLTLICATGIAVVVTIISSSIAEVDADKTYHLSEDIEIYALQDNITTDGSFFLGSGHIDDELKYFYVEKTDLGYTIKNVDADQAYIQYTSDRCHIEKQSYTFNNWFVRLIAIPLNDRYVIYIPEGSIVNNYSVDLK